MYAGHFAAALAMKATEPRVPTWALLVGVGVLDILFGVFVAVGLERAHVTPGHAPGFSLDFIDWSHSLAMSIVWSIVFAIAVARRSAVIAAWCAAAVFSHFVLDVLMHPGDLALWPHSEAHTGLGLWTRWPIGWWFFELGFIVACGAWYVLRARRDVRFGGRGYVAVLVVVVLHVVNSPWLAPTG
jgi:hypothetical protein